MSPAYFEPPPEAVAMARAWIEARTTPTRTPTGTSHVEWYSDFCRWRKIDPEAGWEYGHAYEFKRAVMAAVAELNHGHKKPVFFELGALLGACPNIVLLGKMRGGRASADNVRPGATAWKVKA